MAPLLLLKGWFYMMEEQMKDYTKVELMDGTVLSLDPKLNLKKLMYINRDFKTDEFAKMTMGDEEMNVSVVQGAKAVYIAYRQANMHDYISYDDFILNWEFDMEFCTMIYSLMMFKSVRNDYQKAFEKANKEKKLQK